MPQHTPALPAEAVRGYEAARSAAASCDRTDLGRIVVSGKDRASYLHGLLTNDIATLQPGMGCYAAYLTPQGRMIADLWVFELGDVILLQLSRDVKDLVLQKLDQFVFTEDVQLGDVSDTFAGVAVVGPSAASVVGQVVGAASDDLERLAQPGGTRSTFHGLPAIVLRTLDAGVPGFEVLVEAAAHDTL